MRPEIVAYHEAGHAVAFAAFLQGLQELGWTVGRNVQIDFRGFTDDASRIRRCGSMWPRLHAIVAPFVIDGPLDGKIFRTYVERLSGL
jgi:hypothetical protein